MASPDRSGSHVPRRLRGRMPVPGWRRGHRRRFLRHRRAGRTRLAALLAVAGPGLLAGLSDDDPAGVTTYSVLGADHGYALLWTIPASTLLLVLFHLHAVRVGAVTGRGLVGLVRERFGHRAGWTAAGGLLAANMGTICAEFAGIAAAASLAGIPAPVAVLPAATLVGVMVVRASFHRIQQVLLLVASLLGTYLFAALLAKPDWSAVVRGSIVPTLPSGDGGGTTVAVAIAATLGTTLAPWGLAFIQSYAVDKRLGVEDLRYERVDVWSGSLLTGIIGMAVAVTCAVELHAHGIHIEDAGDAARALTPLAGRWAGLLFGVGLTGAALLAAAVVPMSTAYSIAEAGGAPHELDGRASEEWRFYGVFIATIVVAAAIVCIPGMPLVPLLVLSQVVNAVLLLPHLVLLTVLARERRTLGEHRIGIPTLIASIAGIAVVLAALVALVVAG